jgi:hypothetical protein
MTIFWLDFFFFFPVWSELVYECWNSSAWWVNSRVCTIKMSLFTVKSSSTDGQRTVCITPNAGMKLNQATRMKAERSRCRAPSAKRKLVQLKAAGPVHMLLTSPGILKVSVWCLNDSIVGWLRNSGGRKFQVTMVLGRNEYLYASTLVLICRILIVHTLLFTHHALEFQHS